jgi:ABC-type Co2+ transport system permease subunit
MNSQTLGLRVAGVIFGIVALAQLLRLVIQPEVLIDGWVIPLWPNAVALVLFAALCAWLWQLSYRGTA